MDCREAEEFYTPYLLGALEPRDRRLMDAHLEGCRECSLKLSGDGETLARFAASVPQLEVPSRVKQRLFSRIEREAAFGWLAELSHALMGLSAALGRSLESHAAKAVAATLVLGLVLGGLWFNLRLNQLSDDSRVMSAEIEYVTEREEQVMKMVSDQRYFTYQALRMSVTPGTAVTMLSGTGAPRATGMIMMSGGSNKALLVVVGLPPLPRNEAYQIWLIKNGQKYSAGLFSVDSTGYGQAIVVPLNPFTWFDGVGITIEPAWGSDGPTGTNVLKGDL